MADVKKVSGECQDDKKKPDQMWSGHNCWKELGLVAYGKPMKCDLERSGPLRFYHVRFPMNTFTKQYLLDVCSNREFVVIKIIGIFLATSVNLLEVFNVGRFEENSNSLFQFQR